MTFWFKGNFKPPLELHWLKDYVTALGGALLEDVGKMRDHMDRRIFLILPQMTQINAKNQAALAGFERVLGQTVIVLPAPILIEYIAAFPRWTCHEKIKGISLVDWQEKHASPWLQDWQRDYLEEEEAKSF